MSLISAVLFCLVFSSAYTTWINDVVSPRGLDFGNGFTAKLHDNRKINASFLDRVSLRIEYGDVGVSVGKDDKVDDLDLNFHVNDVSEGRGKKNDMTLPFLIGFKAASMITAILGGTKLLVLKALLIAKIALLTSVAILMKKIFHSEQLHPSIEIEQHGSEHFPVYAEYGSHSGMEVPEYAAFQPSASGQYYAYNNYAPSGVAAESIVNYSTVETQGNGTVAVNQPVALASKRKDLSRRKHKLKVAPTILTIRRYSVET